jgi:hypothetical protein
MKDKYSTAVGKLDRKFFTSDIAILLYTALATTVCHMLISGNYGYFLDELYTLACSRHLSLAFVDIPPVAPALLALNTAILGDSLPALHFLPSVFSGAVVILAGLMAKELGGGKLAVALAGISAAVVPVWMAVGSLYTYDFLDQFMIISLMYAVLLLLKRENPKLWLAIGIIAGVGIMTKPSIVFFIMAIALALLFTRHRKQYLTKWPWLGVLAAVVIILPALIWQIKNGFPIAQYWVAYSGSKAVHANPLEFIVMQVVGMNFFLLPLWLIGLWYFLFDKEGRKYNLLGVIFVVIFLVCLITGAKMYMVIPAYAMLLAGGAVALQKFFMKRKWKALLPVYAAIIVLTGIFQAPNYMPVLPVDSLIKYYNSVGVLFGVKTIRLDNDSQKVEIPDYFSNRFEWDTLVGDVAEVYNSLPEAERKDTAVVTQNYGWAGAVDEFGGKLGLPKAMCGQLNYYFFSLGDIGKKTWIMIGASKEDLEKVFGSVTLAKTSVTKIRQPYELEIYICRAPKFTTEQAKEGIKLFN